MTSLQSVLHEARLLAPAPQSSANAAIGSMEAYQALCDEAERDYEGFWASRARDLLRWNKPFTKVLDESDAPFYKWFEDGELNASYSCLDRNLQNGNAEKMLPLPGILAAIVDETGQDVPNGAGGILVVKRPWPAMIRTIWGDPERFKKSYFPEEFGGKLYLAGDGSIRDKDTGYFTIMGRIDDVLNVSGHRMGTKESSRR